MGFGAVLWAKWLMPEEEAVQDRHDEPSPDEEKLMTAATLAVGLEDTGLQRRPMLVRSLGLAGGALATVPLVALVGALIKKPGDQLAHTLWGQPPEKYPNGVPMIYADGRRVSPNDIQAGGIATVFPGVPGGVTSANTPTLLIRLRPSQSVKARKGQADFGWGDFVAFSKICTHAGCPASLVRAADHPAALPVPPVAVRGAPGRQAGLRPGHARPCPSCRWGSRSWTARSTSWAGTTLTSRSAQLLGALMTATRERETASEPRSRRGQPRTLLGKTGEWFDERLKVAGPTRHQLNKVFPDHWSFMMGEIALYSFIVLLLTGTFLTFFFDASMGEVRLQRQLPSRCRASTMSQAYASTLHISFDVRGGLIIRQIHHWAALLFVAAMMIHMFRVFFTGAFRKPRELNWIIGLSLHRRSASIEGFAGYSLPDDLLSGTGLRIADAIMLSIPVIGTWVSFLVFGGEFPGTAIVGRLYIVHVLLIPAILLALITVPTWPCSSGRSTPSSPAPDAPRPRSAASGSSRSTRPRPAASSSSSSASWPRSAGFAQINPIWLFGPYNPAQVSAGSQPDWYMVFLDGSTRLFPSWEITAVGGYTIPPLFWPTVVLPGILIGLAAAYPFLEARLTKDRATHHLLQRPRDVPVRTALGAMAITFYIVLFISGGNDLVAKAFDISLNAMTWGGRIALLILPPLAYVVDLPDLPRPAAPRPRGARARHRDRHHQAAAHRRVHRGAPAARPGRRPRPRPAQLRRHRPCPSG